MKEKDIYVAIQTFHTRNTVLCHPRPVVGSCKGYQPSNPTQIHWKIRGTSDIQYLLILDVVHFDSCNIFTTANTTIFRPHQIVAHTFSNSKKAQFNIVFHTIHTHTHSILYFRLRALFKAFSHQSSETRREREREMAQPLVKKDDDRDDEGIWFLRNASKSLISLFRLQKWFSHLSLLNWILNFLYSIC